MTTVCKLTNQRMQSRDWYQWEIGALRELPKRESYSLCSSDVFHAYPDPLLAVLMNPVHGGRMTCLKTLTWIVCVAPIGAILLCWLLEACAS